MIRLTSLVLVLALIIQSATMPAAYANDNCLRPPAEAVMLIPSHLAATQEIATKQETEKSPIVYETLADWSHLTRMIIFSFFFCLPANIVNPLGFALFIPLFFINLFLRQMCRYIALRLFYGENECQFRINKHLFAIKTNIDDDSELKKLIAGGMIGAGIFSSLMTFLSFIAPNPFFILLAITNSVVALTSGDIKLLLRSVKFKNSASKITRAIKAVSKNILRLPRRPIMLLIGGYFASGKRTLAWHIKNTNKELFGRRILIISGDNWLFPEDRRKKSENYPHNKYEIERWKQMVKRAYKTECIYVPIYSQAFRTRLKIPPGKVKQLKKQLRMIHADAGYQLLSAGHFRGMPIRRFLNSSYHRMLNRVMKNCIEDNDKYAQLAVIAELTEMGNADLAEFMIDSENEIYIDAETGCILEKVNIKRDDIVIFEFEQALCFDDIRKKADVTIFVDADAAQREEYFLARRRIGDRYADLTDRDVEMKLEEFFEREANDIAFRKSKVLANILVKNNETLEKMIKVKREALHIINGSGSRSKARKKRGTSSLEKSLHNAVRDLLPQEPNLCPGAYPIPFAQAHERLLVVSQST
ncbi:MAG: hypothetical protein JW946_06340 [Candidatus Omnitrophica bacterium]|nr:hypothetical protein [Candidatus Omnitrophota bacterium]